YKQWQEKPDSIVFVAIADFFLRCGQKEEALRICLDGVKRHPDLISGQAILAKVYMEKQSWNEAFEVVCNILSIQPVHAKAIEMFKVIQDEKDRLAREAKPLQQAQRRAERTFDEDDDDVVVEEPRPVVLPSSWKTLTMARILSEQGHRTRALHIYEAILTKDPKNEAAKAGLAELQ
ncbi:MAG: hypothetical protein HY540_02205, partial [Deltaproteobacteria bacterium]|nr:hypothetical protein [Deltaproteobacteria bacterium]